MHIDVHLTQNIEIGARRIDNQDGLEVVSMDNLKTVRNSRVDEEPRRWECSVPPIDVAGTTAAYDSVRQMWRDTERGLHTFNFYCWADSATYKVRFDSPLTILGEAGHLRRIESFTLREDE